MTVPLPWVEVFGDLDPDEQSLLLRSLPPGHIGVLGGDWPGWTHPGQLAPPACPDGSDWRTWVLMAGRGFGKTLAGAQWVRAALLTGEKLEIALVGATIDEARRVMIDGRSGLLAIAAEEIADWSPSRRLLTFRSGARATLFSGASPDALRGPEHHLAWCDELAKWEKPQETWDMLQLGLRLGGEGTPWPRALITTTPRAGPVLRNIMAAPDTVPTGGSTMANPHLAPAFKTRVTSLYAGTRLGEQEIEGRLLTDVAGALWTVEGIERCRIASCRAQESERAAIATRRAETARDGRPASCNGDMTDVTDSLRDGPPDQTVASPTTPPSSQRKLGSHYLGAGDEKRDSSFRWNDGIVAFTHIVIGVDPPSGDGTCGIIACAKDEEGRAHVLADHSVTGLSPEGWARAVADAVGAHAGLDPSRALVVAEVNQGGKMVEAVLRGADPALHVRRVTATVGKSHRAEPVARLFEAGKVVLHERFPELEAQLLGMIAGGGYEGPGKSPDRADAMVWALTELMLRPERVVRVRGI